MSAGVLVAWAGWLTWTDVTARRLPDALTLIPGATAVVVAAALDWRVALAGLVWPALYLALGVWTGGVGGGDVKLAVPLGVLTAAASGAPGVLAAIVVASGASVLAGLRRGSSAHGPAMLAAAGIVTALVLMVDEPVGAGA